MKALALAAACIAATSLAADWPLPAKTPNTEVALPNGLHTVGYSPPIAAFTGRFLDSNDVGTFQQTFRTARAIAVVPAPELNRLYMQIGSAVVAYDLDTFFARLEAGEPMVQSTAIPVVPGVSYARSAPYERFLQWDEFFYAENGSAWPTFIVDGQQRLFAIDYDDQGYLYLAYSTFGWGIVKDDRGTGGGRMPYVYSTRDQGELAQLFAFKTTDGRYFVLLQGGALMNVTDHAHPQAAGNRGYWQSAVRARATGRVAIVDAYGKVQIYSADGLAAGSAPLQTVAPSDSAYGFTLITSDGTNFYADAYSTTTYGLTVSALIDQGSRYGVSEYPIAPAVSRNPAFATGFRYGAGHLVVAGAGRGAWDCQLLRLDHGVPSVVDLGDYFRHYYSAAPDASHAVPPAYINITDGVAIEHGGKTYLVVEAGGLGDVYELGCTGNCAPPVVDAGQPEPVDAGRVTTDDAGAGGPTEISPPASPHDSTRGENAVERCGCAIGDGRGLGLALALAALLWRRARAG